MPESTKSHSIARFGGLAHTVGIALPSLGRTPPSSDEANNAHAALAEMERRYGSLFEQLETAERDRDQEVLWQRQASERADDLQEQVEALREWSATAYAELLKCYDPSGQFAVHERVLASYPQPVANPATRNDSQELRAASSPASEPHNYDGGSDGAEDPRRGGPGDEGHAETSAGAAPGAPAGVDRPTTTSVTTSVSLPESLDSPPAGAVIPSAPVPERRDASRGVSGGEASNQEPDPAKEPSA